MKLKLPHRAAEWFLSGASLSRVTRNLTFCRYSLGSGEIESEGTA